MDDDTAARARSATGQPLRPATMQDLQPLAEVYYHSLRSDEWIPAKVSTAPSPDEPGMVKLDCKSRARIDRVYVQVAVTASDAAPPVPEEPPAIGGVSAIGDTEMAAEASVDFDSVQCKAYVDAVLPWLQGAVSEASAQDTTLAQHMHRKVLDRFDSEDRLKEKLQAIIPWRYEHGYINFYSAPRTNKKGVVHVCFLSFAPESYPGIGLFVQDVIMLLQNQPLATSATQGIQIRPKASHISRGHCFGWEADGPVVNGSHAFMYSMLACYAALHDVPMPEPLAQALSAIPVRYIKHPDAQSRLLCNLVESTAQRHAHRSVLDPVFLSLEFSRSAMEQNMVRGFVKLYRQRTSLNSALRMPQRVEDATIRLMQPDKISPKCMLRLKEFSAKYSWDTGPFSVQMLLCSTLPLGAEFNSAALGAQSFQQLLVQREAGQCLAVAVYRAWYEETPERLGQDAWSDLCVACGVWCNAKEHMLPLLMFSDVEVGTLEAAVSSDGGFRESLAAVAHRDPPADCQDPSRVAAWLCENVSLLKKCKSARDAEAKSRGLSDCAAILGPEEAAELTASAYMAALTLDINNYRLGLSTVKDEGESLQKRWENLRRMHVEDVRRSQSGMQNSDGVFWQGESGQGLRHNSKWLQDAARACLNHRRCLQEQTGTKDEDFLQVNVFCLYALGTVKKRVAEDYGHTAGVARHFCGLLPFHGKRATQEALRCECLQQWGTDGHCPAVGGRK